METLIDSISGFFDESIISHGTIFKQYLILKTRFAPLYISGAFIALVLFIINLLKKVQELIDDERDVQFKDFFSLLKLKWQYLAIIFFFPVFSSIVEYVITIGVSNLKLNPPESNIAGALQKTLDAAIEKESRMESSMSYWLTSPVRIFDYIKSFIITPFLVKAIQYQYGLALVSRYYLGILIDLSAPIAIAFSLNKSTFIYFQNWLKSLIISNLIVVFISVAEVFASLIESASFAQSSVGDSILDVLVFSFAARVGMYTIAGVTVWRIF